MWLESSFVGQETRSLLGSSETENQFVHETSGDAQSLRHFICLPDRDHGCFAQRADQSFTGGREGPIVICCELPMGRAGHEVSGSADKKTAGEHESRSSLKLAKRRLAPLEFCCKTPQAQQLVLEGAIGRLRAQPYREQCVRKVLIFRGT